MNEHGLSSECEFNFDREAKRDERVWYFLLFLFYFSQLEMTVDCKL